MPAESPILEVTGVTRQFGGLAAVKNVSLTVARGQIYSIIGPNGAGKSTLFNVISGVLPPTSGRVRIVGTDTTRLPAHKIAALGVSRTFQDTQTVADQSAATNVMLGLHRESRAKLVGAILRLPTFRSEERRCMEIADGVLEQVGLTSQASVPAGELSTADQQRLAIAMAIASDPEILLIDEPTGGLVETEVDELMELISRLREAGITIVLIEHKMRMVMSISDRIAVLDQGELIAEGAPAAVRSDPRVLEAYLGANYVSDDQ